MRQALLGVIACALCGMAAAQQSWTNTINPPRVIASASQSVVRVTAFKREGPVMGTAFSVGDGLFLTASFVVSDADEIRLEFPDGSGRMATPFKSSQLRAYSVIQAPESNIPALRLAEEDAKEGTPIFVVGFIPFEKNAFVDAGRVTSVAPGFFIYSRDSSLVPGLAGSPIVLATGEVVGMHLGSSGSERVNSARALPLSVLRGALPDFAEDKGSGESPKTTRRWRSYVELPCNEVMRGDEIAMIPLKSNERIVGISAALENAENLEATVAPMVQQVSSNSARVTFEVKAKPDFLLFGCKGGAKATLVVDFQVDRGSRAVFKK